MNKKSGVNYRKFLEVAHIIVEEGREKDPVPAHAIQLKLEERGYGKVTLKTIYTYVSYLRAAGFEIPRTDVWPHGYWYKSGWI